MSILLRLLPQLIKSRTMIFNIAALVAGVSDYMSASPVFVDNPQVLSALTFFALAANMVLRGMTGTPLMEKKTLTTSK